MDVKESITMILDHMELSQFNLQERFKNESCVTYRTIKRYIETIKIIVTTNKR